MANVIEIMNAAAPIGGGLAGAFAFAIAKFFENRSGIKALQAELRVVKEHATSCDIRVATLEDKLLDLISQAKP
jgi:hypothetical protein